jgi:3-hydroxy-3-methylglutaryl CoA synthase/uncharacterized OB-fold protein
MSAGIIAFGAYIPETRLSFKAIDGSSRGEKAVAGHDEDAITLGVAAAIDCLEGIDRAGVDAVIFASTTHPYKEKLGASLIARALDLRRDVAASDQAGSLRAGTCALGAAFDAVRAGSARNVLVISADCRMAAPRSPLERDVGDGAAAFLIGDRDPFARLDGAFAVADEILDVWRAEGDAFVRSWEDRFVTKHGVRDVTLEAVRGLSKKLGRSASDYDRAAIFSPDPRTHAALIRGLGIAPERAVDPLFGRVGSAGAAASLLMLASALESAATGQRILVTSYGDGAEALVFSVTGRPKTNRGVRFHLEHRRPLEDYDAYLRARDLVVGEHDRQGGHGISATVHWRDRDEDLGFKAQRCRRCNTTQFPAQRVCYRCFAKDDFDRVRLSDRKGRVLSFTHDHFHPAPRPPTVAGVVEIEGGCRVYLMMTDVQPSAVKLDMEVELTFRKMHHAGGKPNYFWKSTPSKESLP